MDVELNNEQLLLRDTIRKFVDKEIRPIVNEAEGGRYTVVKLYISPTRSISIHERFLDQQWEQITLG